MYFQRYIFSKSYVLMDLEFMILDTFDSLRSSLIRFQSLEEADEVCTKLEDRDVKGQDFTDILALYMKDGGGYNVDHQQYYYDELQHYYDEEYHHHQHSEKPSAKDNKYYQEEEYYGEEGGYGQEEDQEAERNQQDEADLMVKEERQKIMSEYEKLEMQAFESEFNQLIQEST